jgi:hypothetical protein
MKVADGRLVLPDGMIYRLMVLPNRKTISPAVLKRIGELLEAGATIVGPPQHAPTACAGSLIAIARCSNLPR